MYSKPLQTFFPISITQILTVYGVTALIMTLSVALVMTLIMTLMETHLIV